MEKVKVEISWTTYIKLAVVVGLIYFLSRIIDVLVLLLCVLILTAALSPTINRWSKKMPRVIAILLVYLIILIALGIISYFIFPPLVYEIQNLAMQLPDISVKYSPLYNTVRDIMISSQESLLSLSQNLSNLPSQIYSTTVGVIGGIFALFTVFVLSFYILIEGHSVREFLTKNLPFDKKEAVIEALKRITLKISSWMKAQLFLGLLIAIIQYIGLLIIGVPYAITLALWAGIMELIPYLGPVLGAIPALLVAYLFFQDDLMKVLFVLIWYTAVQQLEGHLLVPKIMQKVMGLSPVVIIIGLLIGGKLFGILGVILSIPIIAIITVLIQEYPKLKKELK